MQSDSVRVIHLLPSVLMSDGPSNVLFSLLTELQGTEVVSSVCALYPPPPTRSPLGLLSELGVPYHEFSMSRSFADISILPPLTKWLRGQKPHVLHCHLLRANLYGRVAAKLAGVRNTICVAHNVEDYLTSSRMLDRTVRQVEKTTQGLVSTYIAVSEAVGRCVRDTLEISARVIPNGIPDISIDGFDNHRARVRRELGIVEGDVLVGSVGRLHPQKQHLSLIRALNHIRHEHPNLRCVIAGEGPLRSELQSAIQEMKLQNTVALLGARNDVVDLLPAFDIFAMTSVNEGLPIALIEAMRAGIPSIVTDVGGMPEAVLNGHNGLVVPNDSSVQFAAGLKMLVANPYLREEMGHAARRRYRALYTSGQMAASYREIYHSLSTRPTPA